MSTVIESPTNPYALSTLQADGIELLKRLISRPSFSGQQGRTANLIESFLRDHYVFTLRKHHHIWCYNLHFDHDKPTILLNAHHDTVKPSAAYTKDLFDAQVKDSKLFGLGSNDAGGALVSLITAFLHFFKRRDLPFNICLALTAEEENSGENGLKCLLKDLLPVSFAIIGEPTNMHIGVSEIVSVYDLHPMVKTGISIGRKAYISPGANQEWLDVPSIKMGPGDSARSHKADEFIYIEEIKEGMEIYVLLLESLFPYLVNSPDIIK